MKEKFMRFMYGRYGVDKLSKHLVYGGLIVYLLNLILGRFIIIGPVLYVLGMAMLIYGYYRTFSKKVTKRYQELCAYERFLSKLKGGPAKWKKEMAQRKDYKIFRCPNCKQKLRVPRGKGMVEVRCRKCQTVFQKRT